MPSDLKRVHKATDVLRAYSKEFAEYYGATVSKVFGIPVEVKEVIEDGEVLYVVSFRSVVPEYLPRNEVDRFHVPSELDYELEDL